MGNSQSAPVRSYVLYFERLAGWAEKGQGAAAGPVRGNGTNRWTKGVSQDETGIVPGLGEGGRAKGEKRQFINAAMEEAQKIANADKLVQSGRV
jgi:hypothetical protein